MNSATSVGRVTGILVLAHLVAGLMAPFILLDRVRGSAGLLANAAAQPGMLRAAVLLLFVGSALAVAIAIQGYPVLRRSSVRMAMWLIALGVAGFSLQAVDNASLLTLSTLSRESATASPARAELFQVLGILASATRKWAHYSYLLVAVSWIALLFSLLYRFTLVPRVLAAVGVVTSLLQIAGVTLRVMLGYPPETWLAVPLAPAYAGLALWLMVKGFDEPRLAVSADEHRGEAAGTQRR